MVPPGLLNHGRGQSRQRTIYSSFFRELAHLNCSGILWRIRGGYLDASWILRRRRELGLKYGSRFFGTSTSSPVFGLRPT